MKDQLSIEQNAFDIANNAAMEFTACFNMHQKLVYQKLEIEKNLEISRQKFLQCKETLVAAGKSIINLSEKITDKERSTAFWDLGQKLINYGPHDVDDALLEDMSVEVPGLRDVIQNYITELNYELEEIENARRKEEPDEF